MFTQKIKFLLYYTSKERKAQRFKEQDLPGQRELRSETAAFHC